MKTFLFILFLSFAAESQNSSLVQPGTYFPGISSTKNYVKNPDCAKNLLNITLSGGTSSQNSTTPLNDDTKFDCGINLSTINQTATWSVNTFGEELKGQNCEAKFVYKGNASLYKSYVTQGTVQVTADLQLLNASASQPVSINFPCGDLTTATALVIKSTAGTPGAINIGKVYVGLATNLGVGSVINEWKSFTPTGSFTTNTTYSGVWKQVGDNMLVRARLDFNGAPNAPANCTFNLPSGYTINASKLPSSTSLKIHIGNGTYHDNSGGTTRFITNVFYDTTTAVRVRYVSSNFSSVIYENTEITNSAPVPAAANNYIEIEFSVPILEWSGLGTLINSNCVGTENCENIFSASVTSGGVVSGENVDWINGNCTSASTYVCTFNTSLFSATPNCVVTQDGAGVLGSAITSASTSNVAVKTFNTTTGVDSNQSFQIICQRQLSDRKPQTNAPLLIGSVTTTNPDFDVVQRITGPAAVCSSSPCSLTRKSSGVTSVTRVSSAVYEINFSPGVFSSAPTCTINAHAPGSAWAHAETADWIGSNTSTVVRFMTANTAGATIDTTWEILCQGPK